MFDSNYPNPETIEKLKHISLTDWRRNTVEITINFVLAVSKWKIPEWSQVVICRLITSALIGLASLFTNRFVARFRLLRN